MLHCFGCQGLGEDLAGALGLRLSDLFDEPLPERDRVGARRRKSGQRRGNRGRLPALVPIGRELPDEPEHQWAWVTTYDYADRHGTMVQVVIREQCTVCTGDDSHKRFRQEYVGARGAMVKRRPESFYPVLYRAPEVSEAIAAGQPVWLMEGEKDADAAAALGLAATTNAMGAGAFPDELIPELEGADVVLVVDRDEAGYARGVDLTRRLKGVARSVRVVLPGPTFPKADFFDHIHLGGSIESLVVIESPELQIRHQMREVHREGKRVTQALEQSEAQSVLAEAAGASVGEDHKRFARRWAVEGQVRLEALREQVAQIRVAVLQHAVAEDASHEASALYHDLRRQLLVCHEQVGEPIPPLLRDPAPAPSRPADSSGGGAEGLSTAALGVRRHRFRVWNGAIVQWKEGAPEPGEEGYEESPSNFREILALEVKVIAREFEDADDDGLSSDEIPTMGRATSARARVREHRHLAAVRIRYPDPVSGEEMEWRIPVEEWRDHSWLEGLPGAIDYDYRRSGKETVQRAVMAVSAGTMVDRTIRRCTGWYEQPDGSWGFVHNRGVITAGGHCDEEVALDSGLESYDLPDPIRDDPQLLRRHFLDHSATLLGRLPDRVAAPLLGHVYRSAIGDHHSTIALVGQKATYKTSIAAKAMNHWGESWGRRRYGSSMASDQGDTANTLRKRLHDAKDTLYFMDDFAPTDNWSKAQKAMEETARMVFNQQARGRLERTGKSVRPGHRPRAAGLMTSEVMPRPGSGADRLMPLPLTAADVSRDDLFPLEDLESRHARAAVNASFLCWLAQDYLTHRDHYTKLGATHADRLSTDGFTDREADVVGQLWAGWVAMLDYLHDVTAITAAERDATLQRVDAGLRAALAATNDPDQPRTVGGRLVELLRHAFTQGLAHVDDHRTGDCPTWPEGGRLGWRRTLLEEGSNGYSPKYRFDRQGVRAGYVITDPGYRDRGRILMLEPTALESILKAANGSQSDQLLVDRATAQVALADLGVLISTPTSNGTVRYTQPCRIPAEDGADRRFVVLWLDMIFPGDGDDELPIAVDGDGDGGPPGGETPDNDTTDSTPPQTTPTPTTLAPTPAAPAATAEPATGEQARNKKSHAVDAAQQPSVVSDPQPVEGAKGVDEMPQPYAFTPHAYTDRDGIEGWSEEIPAEASASPCVICRRPTTMTISGVRIHTLCWEGSTLAERSTQTSDTGHEPTPTPTPAQHVPAQPAAPSVSPASRPRPAATVTTAPAAAAAVVDVDGLWTSDGRQLPLPPNGITSVADLLDLGYALGLGTQVRPGYVVDGQLWVTNAMAAHLGMDVEAITAARSTTREKVTRDVTQDADGVRSAREHGVFLGARDATGLGRWTRLWREGDRGGIRVALMAAMNPEQREPRLMGGDPSPQQLARRIGLFTDALGYPFQHGAASTGLDLMRALRPKSEQERIFPILEPVPPAMMTIEDDIDWCRPPTEDEAKQQWCHAYDRGGSYLGGIAGLNLGIGAPQHHPDGTAFARELPGYWRVEIPQDSGDWRHPALLDYTGKRHGQTRWVSTPTLQIALEQDIPVRIVEAYTWPDKSRILDGWYGRMRDARQRLDIDDVDAQVARDQVKEVYTKAIGMLGSHQYQVGKPTYRPDWRHHIQGKSNANILRRILSIGAATGRWPVAVKKDTIVYVSDSPHPVAAWPGEPKTYGRGLGQYHHEGSSPLEEQLPFLTGGTYRGRDALISSTDRPVGGE